MSGQDIWMFLSGIITGASAGWSIARYIASESLEKLRVAKHDLIDQNNKLNQTIEKLESEKASLEVTRDECQKKLASAPSFSEIENYQEIIKNLQASNDRQKREIQALERKLYSRVVTI